jgi:hypothetical protein
MVDLAIIAAVAVGAFVGFRKGFIVPLVVQAGGLLGLWAIYAGPLKGSVPSGIAGAGLGFGALALGSTVLGAVGNVLVGVIHRFGILKKFDKVAGVPLGAATAALTVYVALIGVVTLDGWLAPLHGGLAVGPTQLAAVQKLAALNPTLGAFADPTTLNALVTAATKAPIPTDQLAQYDAALGFYENTVRPSLVGSKLAPTLLAVGENLPVIGQHVDFPTK